MLFVDACWRASRYKTLREFITLFSLSALSLGIWYSALLYLAASMHIKILPVALGVVVVLAELIRLLPITIQGIGLREGAYAYVFTLLGAPSEAGFALSAVAYLALSLAIILLGAIGVILREALKGTSIPSTKINL